MWEYNHLYHYGVVGMQWGKRRLTNEPRTARKVTISALQAQHLLDLARGRKRIDGGQGTTVPTQGSGLGTGPVGRKEQTESARPTGRKRVDGGDGKTVATQGSGLGTGPVGKKKTAESKSEKVDGRLKKVLALVKDQMMPEKIKTNVW